MTRLFWYALALFLVATCGSDAHADPAPCIDHGHAMTYSPCPNGTGQICHEILGDIDTNPAVHWSYLGEHLCKGPAGYICVPSCREFKPWPTTCSIKLPKWPVAWSDAWGTHMIPDPSQSVLMPEETAHFNRFTCQYPGARLEVALVGSFNGTLAASPTGGSSVLQGTLTDFWGNTFPVTVVFTQ